MVVTAYLPSYISSRRVLLIGLAVLLTCVGAALVAAFGEYLTTGKFFDVRQILHHETFEVTIVAFGIGVFLTTVGLAVYHYDQRLSPFRYVQCPIPISYAARVSSDPQRVEPTQATDLPLSPTAERTPPKRDAKLNLVFRGQ